MDNPTGTWTHELTIRVTYQETDGQRRVHHANYLNYFERGRVEMLRAAGVQYKQIEDDGLMLVVAEMQVKYLAAASFDDLLTLRTDVLEIRPVRIRHRYRIYKNQALIVEGWSTVAAVDADGVPRRLPSSIRQHHRRVTNQPSGGSGNPNAS